jgi:predicted nucleic acid-binding protein
MAHDIYVDTSGFYALVIKEDNRHKVASHVLRDARKRKRRFVTSGYILDETATLLKARGQVHLLRAFFEKVFASEVCRVEWTDPESFHDVQAFFLKHADQPWSFTDCVSFCIMKRLHLRDALTKDSHFHEAGFVVLLQ